MAHQLPPSDDSELDSSMPGSFLEMLSATKQKKLGFNKGDCKTYVALPGSGCPGPAQLNKTSNGNGLGRWTFRINTTVESADETSATANPAFCTPGTSPEPPMTITTVGPTTSSTTSPNPTTTSTETETIQTLSCQRQMKVPL
ncbi:hypothetical protein RvY_06632 [Ramazzottius varieornatus]|uniref:Uncharacterized protein n=1 Tax=Ramazzottius varieornatus TaxID=947166 RepID=A0A1D1UZ98_RAMVA|nr:hypothetical protein RvY_06632 [Ramazzottius varieornatus]